MPETSSCGATPIGPDETGGSLHDRLAEVAADALARALPGMLAGTATRIPQDAALATYAPKLEREDGRLDWTWDADRLARRIRAYDPWPGTWALSDDGKRLKVFSARAEGENAGAPGTLGISPEAGPGWPADAATWSSARSSPRVPVACTPSIGSKGCAAAMDGGEPVDRGSQSCPVPSTAKLR